MPSNSFSTIFKGLLIGVAFCTSFKASAQKPEFTNELINETSPYLLQHAHNPVNWHPWGSEALEKAEKEDKLLLISIGYSACHWCHVMEHESFEDTVIARIMNDNFICIKVDREERPDVDKLYMNAARLTTGSGGWPLNAFALADGSPFFGGTYYPKEQWSRLLNYFIGEYTNNREALQTVANQVTNGIRSMNTIQLNEDQAIFSMDSLSTSYMGMISQFDMVKGGGMEAPKFPMPSIWNSLLQFNTIAKNEDAQKIINVTLKNMANGGIYDHLAGGFSRYATDVNWNIPHFEKMLYDNAQLVSLYTQAWQATKDPLYKKVVFETLDFIDEMMTAPKGGFYSSFDADSEGEEGKFYTWSAEEIRSILKEEAPLFIKYYSITDEGNWENEKNILFKQSSDHETANSEGITTELLLERIERSKKAVLEHRAKRVLPGLDDKILTSWNALMLKAYVGAYRTFGEKRHLKTAKKNARFILKNALDDSGELTRNYKNNKSSIPGFMDDYAFVISSFIDLYEATFDESWLEKAHKLTEYTIEHFQDTASQMFLYNPVLSTDLLAQEAEVYDQVIPSSNSEMAINLIRLGHYYANDSYLNTAKQMVLNVQTNARKSPYFYSNWSRAEMLLINEPFEVAITGKNAHQIRHEFDQHYLPFKLIYGSKKKSELELLEGKFIKGQTTIFVCRNKSCKSPTTSVPEALQQMKF